MTQDLKEQKDFYNQYWHDYAPLGAYKILRTMRIMNILLSLRQQYKEQEIISLDLGCGDGRLAPIWREILGGQTYALDLSPKAIQNAKARYPFIHYSDGNAVETPYEDGSFDIVISQEVIEHIEEQQKFIKECTRILKRGGYLVLTTPNKFYFDHKEGGNYSRQPIENIMTADELQQLVGPYFNVQSLDSMIFAHGDYGKYKMYTNRYVLGIFNKLGLKNAWENFLMKKCYGLHLVLVAQKK